MYVHTNAPTLIIIIELCNLMLVSYHADVDIYKITFCPVGQYLVPIYPKRRVVFIDSTNGPMGH